ncbi:(2Fe-2S)-binding protein [Mycobacterium sp. CBMA293]|uniref:2Fe-2S iron-sulfur cluster-binding protein n=1 Tax=unclassified Mycolicibacterium TaxID=2636767 RepID=UPI0012DD94B9|nr:MULTISPECIES: 2Fe-2S iron-sulfur cluster-binding protein [unclassified Mycolicibacterium]MUL50080.1 (2Fe-2S)-binding protein [Mycolicibacterium sp. CBMA 360]MUL62541.1 (2Fe-2S)-binding protein [Mycolicibacterium sp. CBMA 335]MUL68993.1 (2Fe-2S)-binding protein [Mycolicibacterium sp. CBMA 311]MUL96932.1 (2Fe-2S)-binding protein [Mycolicibacterium sp. CBMA 230]MUM04030.1 hypothetical protein [Mycolicibacterium sp. CBMA 213]
MPKVTYVHHDGSKTVGEAALGSSLMHAAVTQGVEGIVGECGGNLMCATCHVFVDESWRDVLSEKGADEEEMLTETVTPSEPNSRLACQIVVDDSLDGLIVHLPKEQV